MKNLMIEVVGIRPFSGHEYRVAQKEWDIFCFDD
jgi:hypothetical protein